jgi:hypothetical protein
MTIMRFIRATYISNDAYKPPIQSMDKDNTDDKHIALCVMCDVWCVIWENAVETCNDTKVS